MNRSKRYAVRICILFIVTLCLHYEIYGEVTFHKYFGQNCVVREEVDDMTDKGSIVLTCRNNIETYSRRAGVLVVTFSKDKGFRLHISIPSAPVQRFRFKTTVKVRVDKSDVRVFNWVPYENHVAEIELSARSATDFIKELSEGENVIVQINDVQGYIPLDGSKSAISEFTARWSRLL